MNRLRKLGLVAKFSLYSLPVLIVLGVALDYFISVNVRQRIFRNFAVTTVAMQETLVKPRLRKSDFTETGSIDRRSFDRFMRRSTFAPNIVLIKIWRPDGTIVWSSDKKLIGRRFEPEEDFRRALDRHIAFELTDLSGAENVRERSKHKELLEVYSPIEFDGKVVGVFEAYYSMDPVLRELAQLKWNIAGSILAVFTVLYIVQFGLVRSASNTIVRQKTEQEQLGRKLQESLNDLQANYMGTVFSLSKAIDARDKITGAHSHRLSTLSRKMADKLNLSQESHRRLEYASVLHDIGKIGVREEVLSKRGALDPEEMHEMQNHPAIGAEIVKSVPFLASVADIVRHHHEKWDGTGYPDGLENNDIPIEARILSVVDAFDAMVSKRPYRSPLPLEVTVKELQQGKGGQFEPEMVDLFLLCLAEEEGMEIPPEAA